jgi:E3 ubiquitin-protein ligase SHPRH
MAEIAEPTPKRRKLQDEPRHRYITIAKGSVRIEDSSDTHSKAENPATLGTFPVVLKVTQLMTESIHGYFAPLARKTYSNVSFSQSTTAENQVGQILKDCDGLESVHQVKDDHLPLACSDIALTPLWSDSEGFKTFRLDVKILWQDAAYARSKVSVQHLALLYKYLPSQSSVARPAEVQEKWNPRDFYENVYVPPNTTETSAELRSELMSCHLYPFQRRAVRWLLGREGVRLDHDGLTKPLQYQTTAMPPSFFKSTDADGQQVYISQLLGAASRNLPDLQAAFPDVSGGVLAEEMGLGKTVEVIALMCLHRRHDCISNANGSQPEPTSHTGCEASQKLKKSRATLIITPPSILEQWKQELEEHAPGLKVCHYNGLKSSERRSGHNSVDRLADNDVVITTYNVLGREIHYASEKPDRQLRGQRRHNAPKSPLTQISWWRVCLDEAQMIESGVSQAAQVARLIPRVNAWAVSGTPLRSGHKDLFGLLLFLQYEPFCESPQIWNRMLDYYRPLFKQILGTIAIRHSKNLVRDDLRLPSQTRHTITVPFTAIEEQHYNQLFQQMCEDVGLDNVGGPLNEEWDPNSSSTIEKMRTWLTRLRQTCLHPEVGGRNRRALGRTGGPLRSVLQVLEVMIEQNEVAIRVEQRVAALSRIRRGQMLERAKDTQGAIDLWRTVYAHTGNIMTECRDAVVREMALARQRDESTNKSDDGEDDEEDTESRLGAYKQRLRAALEVQHMSVFFLGNAYFQMKTEPGVEPDTETYKRWESQEEAAYEEAKQIRAELLSDIRRKVGRLMDVVKAKARDDSFAEIPKMKILVEYGGIESRKIFEKLHFFCEAMNDQARQYTEWRDRMAKFLQESLIDAEDRDIELSGEEYEASTKHQDEMYVYMEALRAMFSDRNDALTGQTNMLIAHEMKGALQAAGRGEGPAPQLFLQVIAEREEHRLPKELGSLRGIISELRQLMTSLQWQEGSARARAELHIVSEVLQAAQTMSSAQQKAVTGGLEKEVDIFRDTMNNRLEYYRGLQKISDTVAPYEPEGRELGDPIDAEEYRVLVANEQRKEARISTLLSKHRYLEHLKAEQSDAGVQRICVICQSTFEQGTLTVCGHVYCRDCILLWWNHHRSCPTCKRLLRSTDFHDITYKPQDLIVQKEVEGDSDSPTRSLSGDSAIAERSTSADQIYSDIAATTLNQIKNIDLREGASFGTKVDTMCRHVLWLREHDPGSKAIFFSQYREFLDVLGAAMAKNQIAFTRVDAKNGIENFKRDPNIECFLLHAKAHSAGLNLVNANHVFLCEPLINTALELQAIARVHRIGQQRETTVWMYLVADTVEESIYDISVTRRLAHLKRGVNGSAHASRSGTATPKEPGVTEGAIDAANSLELQSADLAKLLTSGKSGGEMVGSEDLWQCLFGKAERRGQGLSAALGQADTEVGRFLRAEAAEERVNLMDGGQ